MISNAQTTSAIPTTYASVHFRSRLEARWANFLDRLAIPWEYEPFDLNGYIPDFVLPLTTPVLIEVKPELYFSRLHEYVRKILNSAWQYDAIIVGAKIWQHVEGSADMGLAILGFSIQSLDSPPLETPCVAYVCSVCHEVSFLHLDGIWFCMRCGYANGDHNISSEITYESILPIWKESGNTVQWRGR